MKQEQAQVLRPLEPPYAQEIEKTLENYPQQDGYLLKLFRVFANSERFIHKGVPNLLDKASPLSLREREIVILRVCANNRCEYEWGVHVSIFSAAAKLTDEQIKATTQEKIDGGLWAGKETVLLQVIDQLTSSGELQPSLLARFREIWSLEQQLEVFALCGTYQTISFVANHSEMSGEDFAARFPEAD